MVTGKALIVVIYPLFDLGRHCARKPEFKNRIDVVSLSTQCFVPSTDTIVTIETDPKKIVHRVLCLAVNLAADLRQTLLHERQTGIVVVEGTVMIAGDAQDGALEGILVDLLAQFARKS